MYMKIPYISNNDSNCVIATSNENQTNKSPLLFKEGNAIFFSMATPPPKKKKNNHWLVKTKVKQKVYA